MNDLSADISAAMQGVTSEWKKAKQRDDRVARSRLQQMRSKPSRTTIRDAAFSVMEQSYNRASSHGRYYATARQMFYPARPAILAMTGETTLDSKYFTQTLVKDYLETYWPDWKVVWDARGHLLEPHTGKSLGLGGRDVVQYLAGWGAHITNDAPALPRRVATTGPQHRYANALFIEKEGFTEILTDAGLPERFDMALLSTKGIPNDAACDLIAQLHRRQVRVFVLHDFDLAGFKILRTLREGTRLSTGSPVIDLGLRMEDITGLESETVSYGKQRVDPSRYLRTCGATKEEMAFLVRSGNGYRSPWEGERVEINALTTEQLLAFLERKFEEHGVLKVLPEADVMGNAYRRAVFLQRVDAEIEKLQADLATDDLAVPNDLGTRVADLLGANQKMSWDDAVWEVALGDTAELEA